MGSYARAGQWVGCVKSTIGKWLRRTPLTETQFATADAGARTRPLALELDGLRTYTRAGRTELKVIRGANTGVALGPFGRWVEVIDRAWQPAQLVSDEDTAIAAGIELVYGRGAPQ